MKGRSFCSYLAKGKERDGRAAVLFLNSMDKTYTISQFEELKNQFLSITEPKELCVLLGIKFSALIKHTGHPKYTTFTSNRRGKKRIVLEPEYPLKNIQKRLNSYLQAVYYFHKPDCVHGFVKCPNDATAKLSILSNAARHVGKPFVINADIFRFFPSITGKMVKDVFMRAPFAFNDNLASAIALLCITKNWLPTGAPSSPSVSNFVCLQMDEALKQLASENQYTFTRYADDLSFSGITKPEDSFKDALTSILQAYGFKLNYKKYRVLTQHTRQSVTGIVVNEKLNVNRTYKRNLRAELHNLKVKGLDTASEDANNLIYSDLYHKKSLLNSVKGKALYVDMVKRYSVNIQNQQDMTNPAI